MDARSWRGLVASPLIGIAAGMAAMRFRDLAGIRFWLRLDPVAVGNHERSSYLAVLAAERQVVSPLSERAALDKLMKAPPLVETPRLVLSAPVSTDAEAVFERYASDEEVTKYLGWPRHRTIADTQGFLAFSAVQWEREGAGPYLIWARTDGRLLGSTGLGLEPHGQAITGYVLAKDAWGNGYATEALTAVVEVATDIGVRRLYALCHPQHRASWRVLEKCRFALDESWNRRVEFPNLVAGITQDVLCYRRGLSRHAG